MLQKKWKMCGIRNLKNSKKVLQLVCNMHNDKNIPQEVLMVQSSGTDKSTVYQTLGSIYGSGFTVIDESNFAMSVDQ